MQQKLATYFERLWPICRSITGNGLRESFRILQEIVPFQLTEVPTGTQVHDWEIPKEWNIQDAYILTPDGKISRVFNGISFEERDLKLSLVEATGGKIGTIMDQVVLFCFQFDPNKNKYTIYAYNMMRIGGGFTVFFIAGYLFTFWRKNKNNNITNYPTGGV